MARNPEEAQRLVIPLKPEETLAFLGQADKNLKKLRALLREAFPERLKLVVRGDQVELSGDPEAVGVAERVVRDLLALLRQGAELDEPTLEQAVGLALQGEGLYQATTPETELALPGRLRPKTPGQRRYVEAIATHDITFGVGPAGTGKTYLAVAMAVSHLRARRVKRIVLTRPAVEAGEKLGFLPGDIQAKVDPYLRPLYDALFDMIDAERFEQYLQSGIIEVAPLAFMRGRAQPVDTPVLTPEGFRPMGRLKPGDWVVGAYGVPVMVVAVHPQGVKPIYRVRFSDGVETRATADHLWAVLTPWDRRRKRPPRLVTTEEMRDNLHQHRYEIPLLQAPVEFPRRPVPLDPYALGLLLGDGCLTDGTTPTLCTGDPELKEALAARLQGVKVVPKGGADPTLTLKGGENRNPVSTALRALGLWGTRSRELFVPEAYLWNAWEVRLAVLQGLLDADGSVHVQPGRRARVQFSTSSPRLAQDVAFLVRSLGGVVYHRVRPQHRLHPGVARGQTALHPAESHVLDIRLPPGLSPFRLARKAAIYAQAGGIHPMRFVEAVEPTGEAEAVCITVASPDGLYVTEDFILTHNTLNDAFIILDEAQNTTPEQMKMFLTRMGFSSKMVITGDVTQIDLPKHQKSGLIEATRILKGIEGIAFIYFKESDVVRHPLVARIIKAYEEAERGGDRG
jgi:phosphate starvation-inducible PhoH-like protein